MSGIKIGGIIKFSTVDCPGKISTVVFMQGCAWTCPYCHNHHLRPLYAEGGIQWEEFIEFLETRKGLLNTVVFSGGEPLLQVALYDAIKEVKSMGFEVALHTGGINPGFLGELLPMLSWVGIDVKAPFDDYHNVTGWAKAGGVVKESLKSIIASGVPFEARTTLYPALLSFDDVKKIADEISALGVRNNFV